MTLFVLLATVLLAAVPAPTPAPPVGARVSGPGYDGLIISPLPDQPYQGWQPTPDQIKELETALPPYVSGKLRRWRVQSLPKPLTEFKRQYWGFYSNKTFYIDVHFYHRSTELVRTGQWLRSMVSVSGGGYLFYKARYDASHHVFTSFMPNAPK